MPLSPLFEVVGSFALTPSLIHLGMSSVSAVTTDLHSDVKPSESVCPGLAPKYPMPQVDIRNIVAMLPRLLNLFAPFITVSSPPSIFLRTSGILLPLMPVLDFWSSDEEKTSPSEPRTMTMRPTCHAAWFAITCASQKPTISIIALQIIATTGMTMANSVNTEARGEAIRLFARSMRRRPSFLVSHLNIRVYSAPFHSFCLRVLRSL